jgi:hypothetical protein
VSFWDHFEADAKLEDTPMTGKFLPRLFPAIELASLPTMEIDFERFEVIEAKHFMFMY